MDEHEIHMRAREWARNSRFVAAVDAYTQNFGNIEDVLKRTFERPPFIPAGFDPSSFFRVIDAVADLIFSGDIENLDAIRSQFQEFYVLPERFRNKEG
jgi:hypothetical protein